MQEKDENGKMENNEKQKKQNFYISTVYSRDLPDAWFLSLVELLTHGRRYEVTNGSYKGQNRYQLDYATVYIKHPSVRPLTPSISSSFSIPDPVSCDYLDGYLPYVMCDVQQENEEYTYGSYLEPQIRKVITMYKNGGHGTNQAYMSVGDPGTLDMHDPPCLRGIDTNIIDGSLNFYVYFRSWDLWGGFPANLAAIQMLKEYMAAEIGVKDGTLVAASKGLHIYEFVREYAERYTGIKFNSD